MWFIQGPKHCKENQLHNDIIQADLTIVHLRQQITILDCSNNDELWIPKISSPVHWYFQPLLYIKTAAWPAAMNWNSLHHIGWNEVLMVRWGWWDIIWVQNWNIVNPCFGAWNATNIFSFLDNEQILVAEIYPYGIQTRTLDTLIFYIYQRQINIERNITVFTCNGIVYLTLLQ